MYQAGMHINTFRIYRSTTSTGKVAIFRKRNGVELEVLELIYPLHRLVSACDLEYTRAGVFHVCGTLPDSVKPTVDEGGSLLGGEVDSSEYAYAR
jgi:hypothetical protein